MSRSKESVSGALERFSRGLQGSGRWSVCVLVCAVGSATHAQTGRSAPPVSSVAAAPAAAATGVTKPGEPALARTLCGLLKKVNVRAGTDPGLLRMDLVIASGKAVDYDPAKVRTTKAEIDKLTAAQCPAERELAIANLQVKSLAQAIK